MNLQHAARQATVSHQRHDDAHTRLHGRRLVFARAIWIALVIPSLGLFFIATMLYATQLIPDKSIRSLILHPDPSVSGYIVTYSHLYLQVGSYLALTVVLTSLASLVWIAVGLLICWRKSDDWMALVAAFGLITWGVAISPQLYLMNVFLSEMHSLSRWPLIFVSMLGWGSLGLVLILFPNGRFVPRWTSWVFLVYIVYQVPWSLPSNSPFSTEQWPPLLNALVKLGFLIALIYAQLYRYRHSSNLIERQQTKWVVFAIVISSLVDISTLAPLGLTRSVYAFIIACLYPLVLYLFPLTIGIAVLRYRLWDIDILINRTWVYGTLTVSLALVYVGLVIGLQALIRLFTGQVSQSPVIIVASTLAIYALFQPLRQRIQAIIDRRFYRRKYDAAKTVEAFSATLRSEVDLGQLRVHLLDVVEETMQPTFVSLWVRPPEHDGTYRNLWRANPPGSSEGI
jgi:hypothetical protein